jgi:membrane-bound lytic murein transglycosylase D
MWSALVLAVALVVGLPPLASGSSVFPRPPSMEHQVKFWRDVFTTYSADKTLIHDTMDLSKVYTVIDFGPDYAVVGPAAFDQYRKDRTDQEIERIRSLLLRLHQGVPRQSLMADERRIADMFRNDRDPYKFLRAAEEKRIRGQKGIREQFYKGFRTSRAYLPEMERIFRDAGLPVELTRIPLFESSFNVGAYSKVGAAGIWQFMPATGRLFMAVNDTIDERRDPIASTHGAAQYLSRSYYRLGNWPLAVTSWNHGPTGVARAIDATGSTDIATIVRYYDGPGFGFASRNFYAELLAVLEIESNSQRYFGRLPPERLPATRTVTLDRPVVLSEAARLARTPDYVLADMNPALLSPVISGRAPIPAGYGLRLPAESANGFRGSPGAG